MVVMGTLRLPDYSFVMVVLGTTIHEFACN
jgi:hypothetical protein